MVPLAIFLGGGTGALLRVWLGTAVMRGFGGNWQGGFPLGTLVVNLAGCFIIGVLAAAFGRGESTVLRAFLIPGLLGGFTTFSAFSLETALLQERGSYLTLALYLTASVLGGLCLVLAGQRLGRLL